MPSRRLVWWMVAGCIVILFLSLPPWFASASRRGLMQCFSPLIALGSRALAGGRTLSNAWRSRALLEDENRLLRKQVRALSRDAQALEGLKSENARLRRMLDFTLVSPVKLLPAEVVGRDTREWYRSIIINRGRRDGVLPDMAVASEEGLVGRVIESGPRISTVLLIIDKQSRVGGTVERTRETGVVEGTSFNTCRLNFLPRKAEARSGDRVITSGIGGVYPRGLCIGAVNEVCEGEYGLFSYADLTPSVDFSALEDVLILVGGGAKREGDSPE